MDDERKTKIQTGKEALIAYQKKKRRKKSNECEDSSAITTSNDTDVDDTMSARITPTRACCRCNRNGRCSGCACHKGGRECINCCPKKLGRCLNAFSNFPPNCCAPGPAPVTTRSYLSLGQYRLQQKLPTQVK